MTKTTMGAVLDPARLYYGDAGRLFCGAPRCAGASAAYSGRTIAGQRVHEIGQDDLAEWLREMGRPPRCEGCGREAVTVLDASGRVTTREGRAR
jgi:hypothetical protein